MLKLPPRDPNAKPLDWDAAAKACEGRDERIAQLNAERTNLLMQEELIRQNQRDAEDSVRRSLFGASRPVRNLIAAVTADNLTRIVRLEEGVQALRDLFQELQDEFDDIVEYIGVPDTDDAAETIPVDPQEKP